MSVQAPWDLQSSSSSSPQSFCVYTATTSTTSEDEGNNPFQVVSATDSNNTDAWSVQAVVYGTEKGSLHYRTYPSLSSNSTNKSNKNNKNNKNNKTKNTKPMQEDREPMPLKEQEDAVIEFLQGVIASFQVDASASTRMEEERIIGSIDGEDVGLLIGPKAGTLLALQDITRTVVQRHASGKKTNRLSVDVGGYREKRKASLIAFTQKQADLVKENNEKVELEPMGAADRKIVHDAAAEISGISSSSDGEEPRRYVVLHPSE